MPTYPLPAYHFIVEWGGQRTGFLEVSGLSVHTDVIEYREGNSPESVIKMPGLRRYSNIVMKRGIVKGDNDFFNWFNSIQGSTVERRDLVISVLDEVHLPVLTWKVHRAFPVKVEASTLRAQANEVVIETIELCHEGLSMV